MYSSGENSHKRKNEAWKDKEAAVELRKKTKLRELILSAKVIKDKINSKNVKLTGKVLLVLVRYKRTKGDQSILPKGVAALHTWWNKTKHHASPCCSPNNSDDEEEEDINDEERGEMGTTGLVFGHDKSEDESDVLEYINLHSFQKLPWRIVV